MDWFFVSLIALIIALIVYSGWLYTRSFRLSHQLKHMKQLSQQYEMRLDKQQLQIDKYFLSSAPLMDDVAKHYNKLHNHLMNEALNLVSHDVKEALLINGINNNIPTPKLVNNNHFKTPIPMVEQSINSESNTFDTDEVLGHTTEDLTNLDLDHWLTEKHN